MKRIKYAKSDKKKLPFFTLERSGSGYEVVSGDARGVISKFKKNFLNRDKVFTVNDN